MLFYTVIRSYNSREFYEEYLLDLQFEFFLDVALNSFYIDLDTLLLMYSPAFERIVENLTVHIAYIQSMIEIGHVW